MRNWKSVFKSSTKKVGGAVKKAGVKVKRATKKEASKYYLTVGPARTLAGTKLTPSQEKARQKERAKSAKHTKKVARRIWRKLV